MKNTSKSKSDERALHTETKQPKTDIISRMEAAQKFFQLCDTPPECERAFDGEDATDWQEQSERQGAE